MSNEGILRAGATLANMAYNLAQRADHPVGQVYAAALTDARRVWDDAVRAAPAAVADTGITELCDHLRVAATTGEPITLSHLAAGALHHAMTTGQPQGAAPSVPANPGTAALTLAAQALLDEQAAACVTDPMLALAEMARDGEDVLVGAGLLLALVRAIPAATTTGSAS